LEHDHLRVVLDEERPVDDLLWIDAVSSREKLERADNARGRAPESFSPRLRVEGAQDRTHVRLELVGHRSAPSNGWLTVWQGAAGIWLPLSAVIRSICGTFVIGMMPGMSGTPMPARRARSTNAK